VAVAAAATQPEKERLQALRLRRNIPPDSPEWQFYAVMAPLLAPAADRDDLGAQLERIEEQQKQQAAKLQTLESLLKRNGRPGGPDSVVIPGFRAMLPVVITILACAALWDLLAAYPRPEFGALLAVFAFGALVVLFGIAVSPILSEWGQRFNSWRTRR